MVETGISVEEGYQGEVVMEGGGVAEKGKAAKVFQEVDGEGRF